MIQLENRQSNSAKTKQKKPKGSRKSTANSVGVASTFERQELKNFFVSYLTTMLLVEGLIFFFCFINHLATDSPAFPWKPYLFATFITPIAITFVFGLIILTFNKYFFKGAVEDTAGGAAFYSGLNLKQDDKLAAFFQVTQRLPFLLSLLLLIAATAVAYKLDAIALYAAQAGAATAQYLFFTLIAVMVMTAIGIGVWMILSYRLRQNTLTSSHQYKMQLMSQFGMVLLDDGTMLDKDGKVVYQQDAVARVGFETGDAEVQLIEEVGNDR
ncbi:MAG TPA: hypothetical protein VIR78_09395 [Malonomonas sp.]